MPLKIVICGGGMAGLAAAAYLREHHDVTVLEGSGLDSTKGGFGFSVFSNAACLLGRLGLTDTKLDAAPLGNFWFRDGKTMEEYRTTPLVRPTFGIVPSLSLQRGALYNALYECATSACRPGKPADVQYGIKVLQVDTASGSVRTASGEELQGDLIIGADGITSVTRAAIHGERATLSAPRTNDLVGFITTVPIGVVQSIPSFDFLNSCLDGGIAFFSAEDQPDDRRWVDKKRILMYQTSPREWQILAYAPEGDLAADFQNARSSLINDVSRETVMHKFAEFSSDLQSLFNHSPIHVWRIQDMKEFGEWHKKKAVLIGDAAHSIIPYAGQGFNIALEDAEALAYFLRDTHTSKDVAAALETFVDARRGRVNLVRRMAMHVAGFPPAEEKGKPLSGQEVLSIFQYEGIESAQGLKSLSHEVTGKL